MNTPSQACPPFPLQLKFRGSALPSLAPTTLAPQAAYCRGPPCLHPLQTLFPLRSQVLWAAQVDEGGSEDLSVGIRGLPDSASERVLSERSVLGMSPGKYPGSGFKDLVLLLAQSQTCQVSLSKVLPTCEPCFLLPKLRQCLKQTFSSPWGSHVTSWLPGCKFQLGHCLASGEEIYPCRT